MGSVTPPSNRQPSSNALPYPPSPQEGGFADKRAKLSMPAMPTGLRGKNDAPPVPPKIPLQPVSGNTPDLQHPTPLRPKANYSAMSKADIPSIENTAAGQLRRQNAIRQPKTKDVSDPNPTKLYREPKISFDRSDTHSSATSTESSKRTRFKAALSGMAHSEHNPFSTVGSGKRAEKRFALSQQGATPQRESQWNNNSMFGGVGGNNHKPSDNDDEGRFGPR